MANPKKELIIGIIIMIRPTIVASGSCTLGTCTPSSAETTLSINAPDGSCIINLEKFVNAFSQHIISCPEAALHADKLSITIERESSQGLASIIGMKCNSCNNVMELETSAKGSCPTGTKRWECNIAAVWGQMTTGGGTAN